MSTDPCVRGYEAIKEWAKATGRRVPEMLALAEQNDPFFAGSPSGQADAEWFAGLWQRFGYRDGVHLRRIHYQIAVQADVLRRNGTPYQNTEECWAYLSQASKAARYLGHVSPTAFVDRRNPDPHLVDFTQTSDTEPSWDMDDPYWPLPTLDGNLTNRLFLDLPDPRVSGYGYNSGDQPYVVEVWCEKSTMDDVLLPLCRGLGVNLVTSMGFQSITSVLALLRRVAATGKPARIFYISDFDPSGDAMPVAVARQIEYWQPEYAPGAEIKLTPLALTRLQVAEYRLPRIPVKESDLRKAAFEERYGEGAVELDALEALHPGALARIVGGAIRPYRDRQLFARLNSAEKEAREEVGDAWEAATADAQAELDAIADEARQITETYQGKLDALGATLRAEFAPLEARLETLRQVVETARDDLEVELPERPEPEAGSADEADWLLDTERNYLQQLDIYKARKAVRS